MNEVTPFCLNTGLTDFFPLPRRILELPLSSTAKLAYGVLLDRGTLSRKNRYANEAGEIYVIYTIERLARTLGKGTTAVKRCLKELEKAELIRRERCGMNAPSRIFLSIPTCSFGTVTQSGNSPWYGPKTDPVTDRKPSPNDLRDQPDFIKLYYQYSEGESL